ncbi:glutathione S-transferase family protein [Hoeflea prorocentri]|uniref:Glutathione S-transferase n=1 Tax=Hoeflea prorocentri TaxID=1922333 RepID=A0A9X3UG47_9HYPH|nr:glutathione S-transferase [Hoeflea prorocentri]MCY6379989.1 glutathione S-transferase [Hoeflea prorocentri]MDA5397789.1 glutathione S-transferase [Hoeflea prorocentri]
MTKPYTLHNRLGSGGFAIEAVLALADIPHELVLLESIPGSDLSEEFQKVNPWRQVPVLVTPDGRTVTETAAILFYLAEEHETLRTGPQLYIDDNAAFYRWGVFMVVNLYEGMLRLVYPGRYAKDRDVAPEEIDKAVRRAAAARNHEAFGLIERQLEDRSGLCGDRLSPIDVLCAMLCAWHRPRPDLPRCTALTKSVASHPVVAPIWARNFNHWLEFDWTKPD